MPDRFTSKLVTSSGESLRRYMIGHVDVVWVEKLSISNRSELASLATSSSMIRDLGLGGNGKFWRPLSSAFRETESSSMSAGRKTSKDSRGGSSSTSFTFCSSVAGISDCGFNTGKVKPSVKGLAEARNL